MIRILFAYSPNQNLTHSFLALTALPCYNSVVSRSADFSPCDSRCNGFSFHRTAPLWAFESGAMRCSFIMANFIGRCFGINDLMINEEIRDREVRVVDQNGEQLGVMSSRDALALAEERQLDLVKIAPTAVPPVCKIMDYGKYRFDQSKREKEQRRNQTVVEMKEVQLSATIDTHDMEVKAKACNKFLQAGNKVKVSIRFRGRQAAHGEIGVEVMNAFLEMVSDSATVEKPPKQEGRNMYMFLAPKANK